MKQYVKYFTNGGIIDNDINNYLDQHPGYSIYLITPCNKGFIVVFNIDTIIDTRVDTKTTE